MKVDSNLIIGDRPFREVRDLLRKLGTKTQAEEWFAGKLYPKQFRSERHSRKELSETKRFIAAMQKEGYLEKLSDRIGGDITEFYKLTDKAIPLAHVLFLKRMDRAKADRIVAAMLGRADAINC